MHTRLNRKQERSRRARETVNTALPEILRTNVRARHGVQRTELVVDPPPSTKHVLGSAGTSDGPKIRLLSDNVTTAAAKLTDRPVSAKRAALTGRNVTTKPNVAILNMASSLKPGGGFLDGANNQEEFLCHRTTLYSSLWREHYPLPDLGGIYSPDVMVFRDFTPEANDYLKRECFFVDIITASTYRFPDAHVREDESKLDSDCSCGVSYCDRHRESMSRKMKAVLRMAQLKGAEKLVLGAWGCGHLGHPIKEVAKLWRKVLVGGPRQRRPNTETWAGIKEVVFAIPDRTMLCEFKRAFDGVAVTDSLPFPVGDARAAASSQADPQVAELMTRIAETEAEIEMYPGSRGRGRFQDVLGALNKELALRPKSSQPEATTPKTKTSRTSSSPATPAPTARKLASTTSNTTTSHPNPPTARPPSATTLARVAPRARRRNLRTTKTSWMTGCTLPCAIQRRALIRRVDGSLAVLMRLTRLSARDLWEGRRRVRCPRK